jgi:hypothetical protein
MGSKSGTELLFCGVPVCFIFFEEDAEVAEVVRGVEKAF